MKHGLDLKPCPNCGELVELDVEIRGLASEGPRFFQANCASCGMAGPMVDTLDQEQRDDEDEEAFARRMVAFAEKAWNELPRKEE